MTKENMKKSVLVLLILLAVLIPLVIAQPIDDLTKQVQRAAFYAENYESGNPDYNYAKLIVYFFSVEKEMNALLKIEGESQISTSDLEQILGKPDYTFWVQNLENENDNQLTESVPQWINKIIFDGDLMQVKLSVAPYLDDSGKIVYQSNLFFLLKQKVSIGDLKNKLPEITELAKTYSLYAENEDQALISANNLAETSINWEVVADKVFEQSVDPYQTMLDLFGEESIVKEETVASKEYKIYDLGDKKVFATVLTCEDCKGIDNLKWINLDMRMEDKLGNEIGYYLDDFLTGELAEMDLNALKVELINRNRILNEHLDKEEFSEAYNTMNEMEIISRFVSDRINEGDQTEVIKKYIEMLQFYVSESGFFSGYPLTKTDFYKETKFQKIIYVSYENENKEICDNDKDDNNNNQIDCQEEFCSGQICGSEFTTDENGTTNETTYLYCISGECKKKEDNKRNDVCGDGICSEGEKDSCDLDCVSKCLEYAPIDCPGKVIFKGTDELGCPLPPTCIKGEGVCSTDSDCLSPLCGRSQCIKGNGETFGVCTIIGLEQCSQKQCVDGEKKVCKSSNQEIITHICELGQWKITGERCPIIKAEPIPGKEAVSEIVESVIKETPTTNVLVKEPGSICPPGEISSLGKCTAIAKNTQTFEKESVKVQTNAKTLTGFTINLNEMGGYAVATTGNPISGNPITGVAHDPDVNNPDVLESPTTLPPARNYDGEAPTLSITGGVRNFEEVVIDVTSTDKLQKGLMGDRNLPPGVSEAYMLEGILKTDNNEQKGMVYFSASGTNFGPISALLDKYRREGVEQLSWKLQLVREENRELASTLNNDWVVFFENYLLSDEDLSTKKEVLYKIYNKNFDIKKEMALLMNGLKIKSLDWDSGDFINVDKKTEIADLKISEPLKQAKFKGLYPVDLPVMSMDATIVYPKEHVKNIYKIAQDARKFVSDDTYRQYNFGVTKEELKKYRGNEELKNQVRELISTTVDKSFDSEISFVSKNEETGEDEIVYNIFVSLSDPDGPNPIKISVMNPEDVPVGLDSKITANFDDLYDLLETTEQSSWKYTLHHSELDNSFRPKDQINKVIDYFLIRNKLSNFESSLDVFPQNQKVREVVLGFVYSFGDPGKPSDY